MNRYEKTPQATATCLALIVAGFVLLFIPLAWLTSADISGSSILLYEIIPMIVAGYVIGLGAIAITHAGFPRSDLIVVLAVVGFSAAVVALPVQRLVYAASRWRDTSWAWADREASFLGTPGLGAVAMLLAVPLAIATWVVISRYRPKRAAR